MVLHGESVQLPTSAPLCVTVRTAAFAAAGEASARTSAAVRTAQRRGDRDRLQEADKDFTFRSKRKASKPFTSQPLASTHLMEARRSAPAAHARSLLAPPNHDPAQSARCAALGCAPPHRGGYRRAV